MNKGGTAREKEIVPIRVCFPCHNDTVHSSKSTRLLHHTQRSRTRLVICFPPRCPCNEVELVTGVFVFREPMPGHFLLLPFIFTLNPTSMSASEFISLSRQSPSSPNLSRFRRIKFPSPMPSAHVHIFELSKFSLL